MASLHRSAVVKAVVKAAATVRLKPSPTTPDLPLAGGAAQGNRASPPNRRARAVLAFTQQKQTEDMALRGR